MALKKQQQSLSDFFQVKKKLHTEPASRLPTVIRYENEMEIESSEEDLDIDDMPITDFSPPKRIKPQTFYSYSQEDMRLKSSFNNFVSSPFPFDVGNTMNTMVSENSLCKNLNSYFIPIEKRASLAPEHSMPIIEESPPKKIGSAKKYRDNNKFLDKWIHQCPENQMSGFALPKEIMLRVMTFLTLKDNARMATACKYFKRCFRNMWLSFEYFSDLNFSKLGANQANQVLRHGGKLPHIQCVKDMVRGKNPNMFFKRNILETTISPQFQKHQSLFKKFSLRPQKANSGVFITDQDFLRVSKSSRSSLLVVNLVSCHLLTEKTFQALASCKNLQYLSIRDGRIKDDDVHKILEECRDLRELCLTSCEFLTDATIQSISELSQKLKMLDLSANHAMKYENLYKLVRLLHLQSLSLGYSCVETDHMLAIFKVLELKTLEVESCKNLNNSFLGAIMDSKLIYCLERLDLSRNKNFSEEAVWEFVNASTTIVEVSFPLISGRILDYLLRNKVQNTTPSPQKPSTQIEIEM